MLSLRQNERYCRVGGHAPPQRHLKRSERDDERRGSRGENNRTSFLRSKVVVFPSFSERGQTGENARANAVSRRALSPVKIKNIVATADMRRHSDTLRGAQRRRKRGSRGENNRTSFLRSKVVVFPSFSERGQTGENARANAVSRRALSPVKIKNIVATADMRRHSDTLRGAQRRRKRGSRGENRISKANSVVFPSFSERGFICHQFHISQTTTTVRLRK